MACCATGPCGRPGCRVCGLALEPLQPAGCQRQTKTGPCRSVLGHYGPCLPPRAGKAEVAELKESKVLPDLSGPRAAAIALGQVKRHRDGPHRGNA